MNARASGIIILLAGFLAAGIAGVAFPDAWRPIAVGAIVGIAGLSGGRGLLSDGAISFRLFAVLVVYGLCVGGLVGIVSALAP